MSEIHTQIDQRSDGHVHTSLCNHAVGEMEEYVQAAISRGLREIIFLEHLEAGIDYFDRTWLDENDFDYYFSEGRRLTKRYSDAITIGIGVEVGYNPAHRNELLSKLSQRTWSRIGISCHFVKLPETNSHLNLLSRKPENLEIARTVGVSRLLTIYFDTLLEAVEVLPGNVLCHLDAALRFLPELQYKDSHFQQVETLLATVKDKGMKLEINTSGFAIRNEPFPAKQFLAAALRYRIPLVAGSDAHRPLDVGNQFELLPDFISSSTTYP